MDTPCASAGVGGSAPADPRRWLALSIVAVAQLMIVVDGSIVTIALPTAQRALGISGADRQWVVTAYSVAFGGLLLLGGRVADYAGRKRAFVAGLIGFSAASAFGGLATDAPMLFAARAVQGGFAAVMAPAALSLLTVTFTNPAERAKAFGVFGAIAGGGVAIGLVAGGILVQYASWRWCLLVNAPIGVATALAGARVLHESKVAGAPRYDVAGALVSTAGLVSLVYGATEAATGGWGAARTLGLLAAAAVLLAGFVAVELHVRDPLLPLRVVTDRNRGGAFLTSMLAGAGLFGLFLFLSYYLQGSLHYSAVRTGFAFVPFSVGCVLSSFAASYMMTRVPPRVVMGIGLGLCMAGLLLLTTVGVDGGFVARVLPGDCLISSGVGLVFVPVTSASLSGVHARDAGVASALVNATQQVGGAIGTALLNTLALSASAAYLASHGGATAALDVVETATVHGYATTFWMGAVILAVAFVAVMLLIDAKADSAPAERSLVVEGAPLSP